MLRCTPMMFFAMPCIRVRQMRRFYAACACHDFFLLQRGMAAVFALQAAKMAPRFSVAGSQEGWLQDAFFAMRAEKDIVAASASKGFLRFAKIAVRRHARLFAALLPRAYRHYGSGGC